MSADQQGKVGASLKSSRKAKETVKVLNAAIDADEHHDKLIIRGRLDSESFSKLLVDRYQREALPESTISGIMEGFKTGSAVPDITLGMRGDASRARTSDGNTTYFLDDHIYIIDGLQRVTAALKCLEAGIEPRLGATIYLDTDRKWEREMFETLNMKATRLAGNVILRNKAADSESIRALLDMCNRDLSFALHKRVQWGQRKRAGEIVSACSLFATVSILMNGSDAKIRGGVNTSDRLIKSYGPIVYRHNVREFFELIDQCWGIRTLVLSDGPCWVKLGFLKALALVMYDHTNFWNGNRLEISRDTQRKIASFPVRDPQVRDLASSSGPSRDILAELIIRHFNSGKRTRHLRRKSQPRSQIASDEMDQAAA